MLPTKGYFQDIDCPYYDSQCGRPYCHFRHKKKLSDPGNDSPKESEVPTYKPTPKSQLANNRSHIPISYVPDLAFRPERSVRNLHKLNIEKPVYKPTPLSILSSVNKQHAEISQKVNKDETASEKSISEMKHIEDEEYNPVNIAGNFGPSIEYTPTSQADILSEIDSTNEYTPVGENCVLVEYNPTSSNKEIDEKSDKYYLPTDNNECTIKYTPTEINFEDFSNEFDMIDEIISDDTSDFEKGALNFVENVSMKDDNEQHSVDISQVMLSKLQGNRTPDSSCDIKCNKPDSSRSNSSQHSKSSSSHHSKKKLKSESSRSPDKKLKHSNEKQDKKSSNKTSDKLKHKVSDSSKHSSLIKKDKNHHDKHKTDTKEKRYSSSSSSSHKSKHKSSDKYKDKEKKHSSSSNSITSKEKHHKDTHKIKQSKTEKHEDKNGRSKSQNKNESKRDKQNKNITGHVKEKHKDNILDVKHHSPEVDQFDFEFALDDDDDETMEECYRIFNEYKPPEVASSSEIPAHNTRRESESETEVFIGKKRIAHTNADKIMPKIQMPPVHTVLNAAQAMTDRFKLARLAQANNEQSNIISEIKNISVNHPTTSSLKRSAPPSLKAAVRNYKIQKTLREAQINQKPKAASLVDQIITSSQKTNAAVAKFGQRRIAPVSNVLSIQKAKERIEEMKQKAAESVVKTIAKTVKGGKRMAHIPEFSLSDIPDVLQADKSKFPVNVRTRFLTMIAEECGKLYLTKEDAYTRALNEEFGCHEKCNVLLTYKNSAMLAVNRIRKEHQEREKQGLGRIYSGDATKEKLSEFKGKRFFNNIKHYILTDEELDVHGFPKESTVPGKAVIKNRKQIKSMPLEEYQRKCARCSKIYVVDEDGFAFYEEECLYHPLKKRTLNGEQKYLCCKSGDDSGCVISHTHVSECSDEWELEGYQTTMAPESDDDPRSFAVYALDCEMCYTTKGLELTRVTIIDSECKTVYETLVKPLNPIVDYNTRFSGITREQMERTSTSILQVQANILHLCNSETVLIGHSLESDMKALKIIHGTVIDTSVLFPHRLGLPHKRPLRALASEYLKKIIQNDISGHDSAEDAITCMELIKWKLKEELKVRGVKC